MPDDLKERVARCTPARFRNVSLEIDGTELIKNISCTLEPTGKTIIIGPNGAGKSLFLRLLAGIIEPTQGKITGPENPNGDAGNICQILVFQKPVLLRRSAFENIAFVLRQKNCPRHKMKDKVMAALEKARLADHAKTPARALSGGEQQRLALARALVVDPAMLLLDEPTASLDPASTYLVQKMVCEADNNGTKIILVTHDIKQAKQLADDILFIHDGQIKAHQPARAFFDQPDCSEAQDYLDGRLLF